MTASAVVVAGSAAAVAVAVAAIPAYEVLLQEEEGCRGDWRWTRLSEEAPVVAAAAAFLVAVLCDTEGMCFVAFGTKCRGTWYEKYERTLSSFVDSRRSNIPSIFRKQVCCSHRHRSCRTALHRTRAAAD